jgi:hypothetical protein
MSIKNLKITKKAKTLAFAGVLGTAVLMSGCGNYTVIDTKYDFNKAIIFSDDSATIIELKKWTDYDGEQLQLETKEGLFIVTSSFDTKLIDDKNSDIKAEELVRSILGEDAQINYLNGGYQKTK